MTQTARFPILALGLILFLSGCAFANPVDYVMVGSSGDVVTFQLPSLTPTVVTPCFTHPPDCFAIPNETVYFNGVPISGLELAFYGPSEFGGLTIDAMPYPPEYVNTSGPVLFTGSLSNPTMMLGVFGLTTDLCCGALYTDPTWVLTVTKYKEPRLSPQASHCSAPAWLEFWVRCADSERFAHRGNETAVRPSERYEIRRRVGSQCTAMHGFSICVCRCGSFAIEKKSATPVIARTPRAGVQYA